MVSSKSISQPKAIQSINRRGILLVYPIDNRPKPDSIWSEFYDDKMRWEWDAGGDDRVAKLWHIKTVLSTSREVVYTKWYQGRATFFSKEAFTHMLAYLATPSASIQALPREAKEIFEVLEMDSPQSTKQIKVATDLRGKTFERVYEKSMKALSSKLWTVGFGEVDDGAFPSLAVGASKTLFEDLWEEAKSIRSSDAKEWLVQKLGADSLFLKYADKVLHPPVKPAAKDKPRRAKYAND